MNLLTMAGYPACGLAGAIIIWAMAKRRATSTAVARATGYRFSGEAITNGLRAFNAWRDDFLIELSTLMLMAGFIIGTVDVLSRNGLSNIPMFNDSWAIIQAIAIDGLFFAVWGRIRRATWSKATGFQNVMLILVGLLLSIVAALVNGLLSYQELNGGKDITEAMASFGIDQITFSYARAILVVLVAVLVALFARNYDDGKKAMQQQLDEANARATELEAKNAELQATLDGLRAELDSRERRRLRATVRATVTEEQATEQEPRAIEPPSIRAMEEQGTGYIATDDGATIAVANADGATIMATGSHRDRIKEAMLRAMQQGQKIKYEDIAEAAQVGYSTVKKWAPEIKEELASELPTLRIVS